MDEQTIEEWFLLYERDITSFLTYYTGSLDVEDLVQDTFLIALRKYSRFNHSSHPKTWLIAIARNLVIDRYRRTKVWERIKSSLLTAPTHLNELEESFILNLESQQLYRAIHKLPPQHKEVVILRGILELSSKEASEILKCTTNKTNVLYHRALKKLKEILEKEGFFHESYRSNPRKTKGASETLSD
ncbi:RNA polymerase sigma factor [Pseudalkalibacillus sp. SCS-8]|uniref:RNA polymerase sigma factor n=1 Tax=Pseudalkalibacillus nanhaiensis TaxID=3115291 RepID=UPI0032D9EC46